MNSTGCPAGTGVALAEGVLLATIHPLSSKPGPASGFSVAYFQLVSAGSATAGGPLSGARLARLPEAVRVTGTGRPFHHATGPDQGPPTPQDATGRGAQPSSDAAVLVSPVSARTAPRTVPVPTSSGPLTSTGPAAVSVRQITAAAVSSAASRSSGRPPAGVIKIRVSPWCG